MHDASSRGSDCREALRDSQGGVKGEGLAMVDLVIFMAVVALIVVWVRKRKRRARENLDLTLAVVGFEASGKTVFIGSMFNELRVPDASGVFLDTTPENAGKLLALYNTTADTDKQFPDST